MNNPFDPMSTIKQSAAVIIAARDVFRYLVLAAPEGCASPISVAIPG
jgi:hypothetical protein